VKQKEIEEQLGLAHRLSKVLLSSSNLDEIGSGFTLELKELMSLDWGAIGLIEESQRLVNILPLSSKLKSDWEAGNSIPLEGTPVAWVAQKKKALLEKDLQKESLFWTGEYWLKKGLRTITYMPLFTAGEVFGAVIFASLSSRAYGERELRLLKYTTAQLSFPILYFRLAQQCQVGQAPEIYTNNFACYTTTLMNLVEVTQEVKESLDQQNEALADLRKQIKEINARLEGSLKSLSKTADMGEF
jgi:hypothetical protein